MRRRAVLAAAACAACAALAAGCADSDPGASGPAEPSLVAWDVPEIYLPPPTPAGRGEPTADEAGERARPSRPARAAPAGSAGPVEPAEPAPEGAPSDAQVQADLREAFGSADVVDRASLTRDGLAQAPAAAPGRLRALITGANQVARKPYVYGGGHGGGPEGVFTDSAYDCSGSISYALASAGFIESPMASGPMMSWGKPGPGKWVTIYANEGHAYMVVAGLRFDTSGRAERDTRWQSAMRPGSGFVARHPPGL